MSRAIPFRRRSSWPSFLMVLGAVAAAVIGFAATMAFLNWQSTPRVVILRPDPRPNPTPQLGRIEVVDGDTVRFDGVAYRLVGMDTPERGDKARCDDERRRAEAATRRLRVLVARGDTHLTRMVCSCRPGQEGTRDCDYGRLCGSLSIGGQDVATILIREGLAHPYICGATSCPPRRRWC